MTRREMLAAAAAQVAPLRERKGAKPRNVVFILTDDHRYDALGFMKSQSFLETPNLDRMAAGGAHMKNAFVTTALCSPSRATILTGVYAHKHRIVDNNTAIPPGTTFFPQHLQKAGYSTAFFGKWHMGHESDNPQPGFDKWVSFLGQGSYVPEKNGLNVDGRKVAQKGYITDELTDYAVDWLKTQPQQKPFFLYLSHKAVHSNFTPAPRHLGKYANAQFKYPPTMAASGEMAQGRPMWVQNQRNSFHGIEYPYHSRLDIADYYKRYAETLLGVDDSVGRVLGELDRRGQLDSTLVVYMGDNGFAFGEHGLIDKRTAYEESMRVPMLVHCPELFGRGKTITPMAANLDIMPTVLDAAGLEAPAGLDGASLLPLLQGREEGWRKDLLYEYYWERNFPHTPTVHSLRTDRYKFIRVHGLWDLDELYDLQEDPLESRNLIASENHTPIAAQMRERLFEVLEKTGGNNMPLWPDRGGVLNLRDATRSKGAAFPSVLERTPPK